MIFFFKTLDLNVHFECSVEDRDEDFLLWSDESGKILQYSNNQRANKLKQGG